MKSNKTLTYSIVALLIGLVAFYFYFSSSQSYISLDNGCISTEPSNYNETLAFFNNNSIMYSLSATDSSIISFPIVEDNITYSRCSDVMIYKNNQLDNLTTPDFFNTRKETLYGRDVFSYTDSGMNFTMFCNQADNVLMMIFSSDANLYFSKTINCTTPIENITINNTNTCWKPRPIIQTIVSNVSACVSYQQVQITSNSTTATQCELANTFNTELGCKNSLIEVEPGISSTAIIVMVGITLLLIAIIIIVILVRKK